MSITSISTRSSVGITMHVVEVMDGVYEQHGFRCWGSQAHSSLHDYVLADASHHTTTWINLTLPIQNFILSERTGYPSSR